MLVKKRERLIDQTRVEVVSQIVFDMPGHADENTPLQKKKEAAERARNQDIRGGDGQFGPGNLGPFGIDGAADNQRNAHVEDNTGDDADDSDNQRSAVRPKIPQKLAQIIHEPEEI